MAEVTAYLFVDKNGDEWISNDKPKRGIEHIKRYAPENENSYCRFSRSNALISYAESKIENGWYTSISDSDYGDYVPGEYFNFDATQLPAGTIEKLIGKQLSFFDEPIKID